MQVLLSLSHAARVNLASCTGFKAGSEGQLLRGWTPLVWHRAQWHRGPREAKRVWSRLRKAVRSPLSEVRILGLTQDSHSMFLWPCIAITLTLLHYAIIMLFVLGKFPVGRSSSILAPSATEAAYSPESGPIVLICSVDTELTEYIGCNAMANQALGVCWHLRCKWEVWSQPV